MSDDESKEPVGKVPEGMVRKQRKVRRKRRTKESSASANKVFAKGKDILFGMQEDEDHMHVDVAEQLRRLKKDEDEDKPLDDVWGTKRRSSSWLWILLLGIIMPLIVIGIILSKLTQKPEVEGGFGPTGGGIPQDDFSASDGPNGWFLGNSEEATAEVIKILSAFNEAKSPEDIAGYIRESPFRGLNPISLDRISSPFVVETISDLDLKTGLSRHGEENDNVKRGYLEVQVKHENGKAFTAYFVEEKVAGEKKVLLDWDASMGWGEISMSELVQSKPRKETLIRCLIEKKAIYDVEFGEFTYSGYILSDPENGEYTFAYVPLSNERNKVLDSQLKKVLDYGNFILPLRKDEPVAIRVRHGNDTGTSSVFEIVGLDHKSWVRP